jgi:hypothetical protein
MLVVRADVRATAARCSFFLFLQLRRFFLEKKNLQRAVVRARPCRSVAEGLEGSWVNFFADFSPPVF